jgi:hypothetical protein
VRRRYAAVGELNGDSVAALGVVEGAHAREAAVQLGPRHEPAHLHLRPTHASQAKFPRENCGRGCVEFKNIEKRQNNAHTKNVSRDPAKNSEQKGMEE